MALPACDGRGIRQGLEFLVPYLMDKPSWPWLPDIEHFDGWPVRCLLCYLRDLPFKTSVFSACGKT